MRVSKKILTDLTYKAIGCAIEVHKAPWTRIVGSVYEKCFLKELELQGIYYNNQIWVPLKYKGIELETELRPDVHFEDLLCAELKAQEGILPVHEAILLSYMEMLEKPKGILINFHSVNIFKEGQKTFVNHLFSLLPDV